MFAKLVIAAFFSVPMNLAEGSQFLSNTTQFALLTAFSPRHVLVRPGSVEVCVWKAALAGCVRSTRTEDTVSLMCLHLHIILGFESVKGYSVLLYVVFPQHHRHEPSLDTAGLVYRESDN